MKKNFLLVLIILVLVVATGCKKQNLLEKYNELVDLANSVESYTYTEQTSYGENNLEMTKTVWIAPNRVKSMLTYEENVDDELTTYIDLDENKSYLYYKSLNTAMVTPVADRTLKDFLLPFSRKSNLGDVSEDQIKSIEVDKVGNKSCQKVVVEWKDGQNDYNLSIWYEDETHLPIQYELIQDGAIAKKGFYENVEVNEFDKDLFELPKDTTIQGLGISK